MLFSLDFYDYTSVSNKFTALVLGLFRNIEIMFLKLYNKNCYRANFIVSN